MVLEPVYEKLLTLAEDVGEVKAILVENRSVAVARDARLSGIDDKITALTATAQSDRHSANQRDQMIVYKLEIQAKAATEHLAATAALTRRVETIEGTPLRLLRWIFAAAGTAALASLKIMTDMLDHWPPRWWH